MLSKREKFPRFLKENQLNGVGAEIGVGFGDFSKILLDAEFREFYAIDPWDHTIGDTFLENNQTVIYDNSYNYKIAFKNLNHHKNCRIVREFSHLAADFFEDEYFDFVYIDADHRLEEVRRDIEVWFPKVKSSGILAGHDYFDGVVTHPDGIYNLFGVKTAVDELIEREKRTLFLTEEEKFPSWFIIK